MKKLILVCIVILLTGCQEYQPTNQYLSLIIDLTDKDSYQPSPKEVLSYLNKGDQSDGIELSLRYVAETRYAPKYQFSLPQGETGWLSNEDARRRKRKHLLRQFSDTLSKMNKTQNILPRSEIFRLVVDELTQLSKQEGKRTLLLYSNLREHSSLVSVYDRAQYGKLLKLPKRMAEKLSGELDLPNDLSGITIRILYTPKLEDDKVFTAMVAVYKQLFEPLGAELQVGIDNQIIIQ